MHETVRATLPILWAALLPSVEPPPPSLAQHPVAIAEGSRSTVEGPSLRKDGCIAQRTTAGGGERYSGGGEGGNRSVLLPMGELALRHTVPAVSPRRAGACGPDGVSCRDGRWRLQPVCCVLNPFTSLTLTMPDARMRRLGSRQEPLRPATVCRDRLRGETRHQNRRALPSGGALLSRPDGLSPALWNARCPTDSRHPLGPSPAQKVPQAGVRGRRVVSRPVSARALIHVNRLRSSRDEDGKEPD
jgi:hypothetical protein